VALLTLALPGGLSRPAAELPAAVRAVKAVKAVKADNAVTPAAFAGKLADQPAGEGSTVYEFAPGAGPNEPRVVWIVDRSLDI
ncbi:MAG: hypothetical protein ACRD00_00375, partial [Thermoanaerobaculia bacterium]